MKQSKKTLMCLCAILGLGLALRCWNINQSFWWDEIWCTLPYAKAQSLWETISELGYYFNNHVFYSLLCRLSLKAFGESELTARLPSLIMGLSGIYAIYFAGTRLIDYRLGLLSSLLLAVSAFHIDHSAEARGYTGLALFSLLSSFFYLRALRSNSMRNRFFYCLYTLFGFYSHVFMSLVVATQIVLLLLLFFSKKVRLYLGLTLKTLFSSFLSMVIAGFAVLVVYSPLLLKFYRNLEKVCLVSVDRLPFIKSLINSLLPGFLTVPVAFVYIALIFFGIVNLMRRDMLVALYSVSLLLVPLSLYLVTNPMFVFERYFIFALPFCLIMLSAGVSFICNGLPDKFNKNIVLFFLVLALVIFNIPSVLHTIRTDRQNYREAIRYVEQKIQDEQHNTILLAIGYAGSHFQYYTHLPILVPQSFDQFNEILRQNKIVWCLITAWLPSLRPPHEYPVLYAESPEQVKMHDVVMRHFVFEKEFPAKFPTQIYKYTR